MMSILIGMKLFMVSDRFNFTEYSIQELKDMIDDGYKEYQEVARMEK